MEEEFFAPKNSPHEKVSPPEKNFPPKKNFRAPAEKILLWNFETNFSSKLDKAIGKNDKIY